MLAILAIITSLAVRALDGVEDQRRYEAAQRGLEELEHAVLGSPDDRAADGARTVSGFVADMGRLPVVVAEMLPYQNTTLDALTLRELLVNPQPPTRFDVRASEPGNTNPAAAADAQVRVPGGWRGPYLRLPLGAVTLLDGWGNPFLSPQAGAVPPPRLLVAGGAPATAAGQAIRAVRHLGSDGVEGGEGYARDVPLPFSDEGFVASITGSVEVLPSAGPAGGTVIVRVFSPDPADATKIKVLESPPVDLASSSGVYSVAASSPGELTIGPRVVRAYRSGAFTLVRSGVTPVTLRPGVNVVNLTIDRP